MSEDAGSHFHVYYPGDCVIIWFDLIDEFPDWVPVPNELDTCAFEWGKNPNNLDAQITCEKLSDTAIKLSFARHISYIDGYLGKIKNIPTIDGGVNKMTINRVDYYDQCNIDDETYLTVTPDDTTDYDTVYTMEITMGAIEDGAVSVQGPKIALTGEDYTLTVTFTPGSELPSEGYVQINFPILYQYYDVDAEELVVVYPNEEENFACSSSNFGSLE